MKIVNKTADQYVKFDELCYGEVFIYEDDVCMKVDENGSAVNLTNGYMMEFCCYDTVRKVKATLTIE